MRVTDASVDGDASAWTILDGRIELGADVIDNVVALPFAVADAANVLLEGAGTALRVQGSGIDVRAEGPATFIERYPRQ